MKPAISVVIATRGEEPRLQQTIQSLRETIETQHEIIVVYDGTEADDTIDADQILYHKASRGCGASRHRGIKSAKYAVVFLCDAHMSFQPGFGEVIAAHFSKKEHAKDVTCGICRPSMLDLSPTGAGYTGAKFSARSSETAGEHWCMSAKWHDQKPGPIGAIMGACYAFKRKWYATLGQPLQLLSGWWGDEEYLSAASWLAGGRVVLLDYWAAHLFRDKPAFIWSRAEWMAPLTNRHRLVELLPAPEDEKAGMRAWMQLNPRMCDASYVNAISADMVRPEVMEAQKLWAKWSDRWDILASWTDREATPLDKRLAEGKLRRPWQDQPTTAPQVDVPRVQRRPYIVCLNCGGHNTFIVDRTKKEKGATIRYGKCKMVHCGIRGVMIDRKHDQVMHWGKTADMF